MRRYGIRSLLFGLVALPFVVASGALLVVNGIAVRDIINRQKSRSLAVVEMMANNQAFIADYIGSTLVLLSKVEGVESGTPEECSGAILGVVNRHEDLIPVDLKTIGRILPDGLVDCGTPDVMSRVPLSLVDLDYVREMMNGARRAVQTIVRSKVTGDRLILVGIRMRPTADSPMLGAGIERTWLTRTLRASALQSHQELQVIDDRGLVVADHRRDDLHETAYKRFALLQSHLGGGESGVFIEDATIVAFARIKGFQMWVVKTLPISAAFKDALLLTAIVLGTLLLMFVTLIGLGWLLASRYLIGPLHQLVTGATRIERAESPSLIDITEMPIEIASVGRALNSLAAALDQRQHIIDERTAELTRSNAELERFAYLASHDLQEPLRTVSSYVQLLVRRYRDKLDGEAIEFIDYAVAAAARMKYLLSALLDFSRIGSRKRPPVWVETMPIVEEVVRDLRSMIEQENARVVVDAPLPGLVIYDVHFAQCIMNLVQNGIKFRRRDVQPQIVISCQEAEDPNFWQFNVSDNGIGFEMQYHDKIFEIFQRLHTRDDYPGAGAGLAICKKIVELYGGRIWATSVIGQGTTFSFTLPKKYEVMNVKAESS